MWVFSLHLCTCLLRPLGVGLYYVSGYADTTSREVWPGWATVVAFLVRCFFVRLLAYAMSGYAGPYHGALSGPWWVVAFWPLCANHALCDAGGWWPVAMSSGAGSACSSQRRVARIFGPVWLGRYLYAGKLIVLFSFCYVSFFL